MQAATPPSLPELPRMLAGPAALEHRAAREQEEWGVAIK